MANKAEWNWERVGYSFDKFALLLAAFVIDYVLREWISFIQIKTEQQKHHALPQVLPLVSFFLPEAPYFDSSSTFQLGTFFLSSSKFRPNLVREFFKI